MNPLSGALLALSALAFVGAAVSAPPASSQVEVDEMSELFIIDVGVVDDDRAYDGGPWSFGALMSRLAGRVPPERFVEDWIGTLTDRQIVNGDTSLQNNAFVLAKEQVFEEFFNAWRQRSPGGVLDLDSAPFRLLAIVNRPDLLKIEGGAVRSAGEARFVYAAVDPSVADVRFAPSGSRRFFVIFEYGIPASSCEDLVDWHTRWHGLGAEGLKPVGSPAYNAELQRITDQFTLPVPGSAAVNGSLLNQLRTNEFALDTGSLFWDLREWNLVDALGNPSIGLLRNVTTKQTPAFRYLRGGGANATRRQQMADWMDAERDAILEGTHVVPERLNGPTGPPFLGALAINERLLQIEPPSDPPGVFSGTFWWAPGFSAVAPSGQLVHEEDARVRHAFAMQTCAGCHFWETGTDGQVQDARTGHVQKFSMTQVREYMQPTTLSPFLTGTEVFLDPMNPVARQVQGSDQSFASVTHQFDDLQRRKSVFGRILMLDCSPDALSRARAIQDETGTRVH